MLSELRAMLPDGGVSDDPGELHAHARDWWPLAMLRERRGDSLPLPAAIVRPASTHDVSAVLRFASGRGIAVVPFGGGSGVCGAAQAVAGSLAIDMRLLASIDIDPIALTVRAGAGVMGPVLESALNAAGLTLGHFPQSIDLSTAGGWVATRSAGQKSGRYGRVDDMVIGLTVVTADGGVVSIPARVATSAGPDLARLFAGSEGTLGVIADVTLRVHPLPQRVWSQTARFETFPAGLAALRLIARGGLKPAVARLYDETDATIAFRDDAPGGAVLVLRLEGDDPILEAEQQAVSAIVTANGGAMIGAALADRWWEHRNDAVETLRTIMFDQALGPTGFADTIEIAGFWPVDRLYVAVRDALGTVADVVGCHASHLYMNGTCLYFTFVLAGSTDDDHVEQRYRSAWDAAMTATLEHGGTITHHHGVGLLRMPWIGREMGSSASLLRTIKDALDPAGILNPGKLIPKETS